MTIDFNLDGPPPPSPFRRWATEQLELPVDATTAQARAVLRDRLRDEDFVPPLRWQQAVQVLSEKRAPGQLPPAAVLFDEERRLLEEVGVFAGKFFELPPDERRARWQELLDQSVAQPLVQRRLRALEIGLRVSTQPVDGGAECAELAEQTRELFALHGTLRAARRQAFLARVQPRLGDYEAAAQRLAKTHPELTMLEPELIEPLAGASSRRWAAHADRARAAPPQPAYTANPGPSGSGSAWIAVVLIMVVLGAIRGLTSSSSGTRSYQPTYTPRPTLPALPPVGRKNEPNDDQVNLNRILRDLTSSRDELYTRLRKAVAEQAPKGPPALGRLQKLLPAEPPPQKILTDDDLRFLLREIEDRRLFENRRIDEIMKKLADHSKPDRP